jgi:hypothetical protein
MKEFTCSLKDKLESSIVPKCLTLATGTNSWSKNLIRISATPSVLARSCLALNMISSVFLGSINSHQPATNFKSSESCSIEKFISLKGNERYSFVSSTYESALLCITTVGKSFRYRLNSIGSKIDPCGTLRVTARGF